MTGWTTNLLATAIVLILALGLGRQLVQWWRIQPDDAGTADSPDHGTFIDRDASAVVPDSLYFGETGYALERVSLTASRQEVVTQLRQLCRGLAGQSTGSLRPLTATEQAFLDRSLRQSHVEEEPGQWQMFEFDDGFPLIVVVGRHGPSPDTEDQRQAGPLAEPRRRVLAWGLAVPADEQQWTLYTYRAGKHGPAAAAAGTHWLANMPLPNGGRRTLALRSKRGELTVSFVGLWQPDAWRQHFDELFQKRQWNTTGWRPIEGRWHAQFHNEAEQQVVDLQFRQDAAGRLVGLAVMTPRNGSTNSNAAN